MNQRLSIAKNTMSLFASRAIGALMNIGMLVVLARVLAVNRFGQYTFAISVGAIGAVVADFGFSFLIPREVARQKSQFEEYLVAGFIAKIIFSSVTFLLLLIFSGYFYPPDVRYIIYAAFGVMSLVGFVNFCASFFNAHEQMHYSAILHLMCRLGIFGASMISMMLGIRSILAIFVAQNCAVLCVVFVAFILLFKRLQPKKLTFEKHFFIAILKKTVPFGLFAIGGVVYFQIDNVLLLAYRDMEEIGYYQAAMRLAGAVEMLPIVFSSAIYPAISRSLMESKGNAVVIIKKSLYLVLVIGLPIGAVISMLAIPIVSLVFGNGYSSVAVALSIVAWLVPIRFCAYILGTTLSASGNQMFRTLASWLAMCVNVGMNLIMIPRYGYIGAAITSIATSLFLLTFYYLVLCLRFHRFDIFGVILRLSLPAAALLIFLRFACQLNLFLVAGTGLSLYCAMLIPVGILRKEHILSFSKLVLNRGKD